MIAVDSKGYEHTFNKDAGMWVPRLAKDANGVNYRYSRNSGKWEEYKNLKEEWIAADTGNSVDNAGNNAPEASNPPVQSLGDNSLSDYSGNIDLSKRPVVYNKDGSISTVRSMSFQDESGKEVLIPTVSNDGHIMSEDEAIKTYYKTGENLGKFDNPDQANAFAERLHRQQDAMYSKPDVASTDTRGGYSPQSGAAISNAINPLPDANGDINQQSFADIQKKPAPEHYALADEIKRGAEMLYAGYMSSGSTMAHDAANMSEIVDKTAGFIGEKAGMGKKKAHFAATELFRQAEKAMKPDGQPLTLADKINFAVGSLPGFIAELGMLGGTKLGMTAAMGIQGALTESDKGAKAALIGGAKGAMMGKSLEAAGTLSPLPRTAALAGVGAASDPQDPTSGAVIMGGLGVLGGKGGRPTGEAIQDVADAYKPNPIKKIVNDENKKTFAKPAAEVAKEKVNPDNAQYQMVNTKHEAALAAPKASPENAAYAADLQVIDRLNKQTSDGQPLTDQQKNWYSAATMRVATAQKQWSDQFTKDAAKQDKQAVTPENTPLQPTKETKPAENKPVSPDSKATEPVSAIPAKAEKKPEQPAKDYLLTKTTKKPRVFSTKVLAEKEAKKHGMEVVDHPESKGKFALAGKTKEADQKTPLMDSSADLSKNVRGDIYRQNFKGAEKYFVSQGNPRGAGDTIHGTLKEAEAERDLLARQDKSHADMQSKARAQEEKAASGKLNAEDTQGFADSMQPMNRGRTISTLMKKMRYNGKALTRKDIVEKAISEGATLKDGNLEYTDGRYLDSKTISKTAIDYAKYLLEKNTVHKQEQGKKEPWQMTRDEIAGDTHIEKGKAEAATKDVIDESAQKVEDSPPRKFTKTDGSFDAPAARAWAEKTVDAAIKKARSVADIHDKMRDSNGDELPSRPWVEHKIVQGKMKHTVSYPEEIGHVTIDVPGDGKFKILNTKEHLESFKKKMKKAFTTPSTKKRAAQTAARRNPNAVHDFLKDGEIETAHELARLQDKPLMYGTNGKGESLPYAKAENIPSTGDFKGIDAFIGQDVDGTWAVVEKTTGRSIGISVKTKRAAMANAVEAIGKMDNPVESISRLSKKSQAELEKQFTDSFRKEDKPKSEPKAKQKRRPANADFQPEESKAPPRNADFNDMGAEDAPAHHFSENGMKLHDLVRLAEMLTGSVPKVKALEESLRGQARLGKEKAQIFINALLAKTPKQALKTIAHEIGHVVDWVDGKTLKLGNILGHIAGAKKHLKKYMAESPDALKGPLTPAEIRELKAEAKRVVKADAEKAIESEVVNDYKITPDDIRAIWNSVSKSEVPGLEDYIKGLSSAEKVTLVKAANKGMVPDEVQAVARAANAIVKGKTPDGSDLNHHDVFRELFKAEVEKRRLFNNDFVKAELKELSMEWRPFKRGNAKYDKYRDSPAELYADAISVLFNNPNMLRARAPEFFRGFMNYAKNRPIAMKHLNEILKVNKTSIKQLEDDIKNGFRRAADLRDNEFERDQGLMRGSFSGAKGAMWDRYSPILDLVAQVKLKPENNPQFAIEAMDHVNTRNEGYMAAVTKNLLALKPTEAMVEDIGLYMVAERVMGEHKAGNDKFAARGIDYESAPEILAKIDEQYGDSIKKFTKKFREVRQEWIMDVMDTSGLFSKSMLESFKREELHYGTFKNADYIDAMDKMYSGGNIGAQVKHRLGSFGDIENPLMATIAQDLTMLVAAERNHVVRKTVNMLKESFAEHIRPADTEFRNGHLIFKEKNHKDNMQLVMYLDKGHRKGFYISRDLANSLKDPKRSEQVEYFVNFTMSKPGRVLKTVFTEANPGFWARNIFRDYQRAATNLPGITSGVSYLPYFLRSVPEAMMSGFGIDSALVKDMLKNYELISVADYRSLNSSDGALYRLLGRFHISPADLSNPSTVQGKIGRAFKRGWTAFTNVPRGMERINKIAGRKYLDKRRPDMSKEERRHIILGQIGSPDFLRAGSEMQVYNNILLFGNAIKEGIRSDIEVIKDRPVDYFFNAFLFTYMPRMMMYYTMTGAFDTEDNKPSRILKDQSNYRRHSGTLIPLGVQPNGKSVALTIPLDPFQKFQVNLLDTMLHGMNDGDMHRFSKDMGATFMNELPGYTPAIDLIGDTSAWWNEQQRTDHRGMNVFSREALAQAPVSTTLLNTEFGKHIWNNYIGAPIFRFSTNEVEGHLSDLEKIMGAPVIGGVARALITVADYGRAEAFREGVRKHNANESIQTYKLKQAIINTINKKASDEDRKIIAIYRRGDPKKFRRVFAGIAKKSMTPLAREMNKVKNKPGAFRAGVKSLERL